MIQIEYIETTKLKPYEANAKQHPQKQIEKIAKSISEFGFDVPIVIDKDYCIVKGHGRHLAAHLLGLPKVPCIVVDLPEAKLRASRLADNKVSESDWIDQYLFAEIKELEDFGYSLDWLEFKSIEDQQTEDLVEAIEDALGSSSDVKVIKFVFSPQEAERIEEAIRAAVEDGGYENKEAWLRFALDA